MCNYYKSWLFPTLCTLLAISNGVFCDSEEFDEIHQQDVIDFVNEIKGNIDNTIDPCEDFAKYACGGIKSLEKPVDLFNIISVAERFFVEEEPRNQIERNVRDFYLSWQKAIKKYPNYEEIFQQIDFLQPHSSFPSEKEIVTGKDVAELAAQLNTIGDKGMVNLHLKNDDTIVISPLPLIYTLSPIEFDDFNLNAEEIVKFTKFKNEFNEILQNTKYVNSDSVQIKSIEDLKYLLPAKHFDWDSFIETIEKNFGVGHLRDRTNIQVTKLDLLRDIMEFIDSSDTKTLVNFQILKYLGSATSKIKFFPEVYLRYATLKRIWTDNLSSDRTVERYNRFLDAFELTLNTTTTTMSNSEKSLEEVQSQIKAKRFILANHSNLITEESLNEFYENYENGKFYKNILPLLHKWVHKIGLNRDDIMYAILTGTYDSSIQLHIKNKPYIFYYITENFALWYQFARFNVPYDDVNILKECLKKMNEYRDNERENNFYMRVYATIQLLAMSEDDYGLLKNEITHAQHLMKIGKLVYTTLAQYVCRHGETKSEDPTFRALRQLKYFAEAFSCPKGSKMNKATNETCNIGYCYKEVIEKDLVRHAARECTM